MKFFAALVLSLSLFGCACDKKITRPRVLPPVSVRAVPGPSKLPLYGSAGKDGSVLILGLAGEVNDEMAESTVLSLAAVSRIDEVKAVVLEINSPGGSVDAGFVIARAIEMTPKPVACVVDGDALSAAYYILQSCDARLMTHRSELMVHNASFSGKMVLTSGVVIENWRDRLDTLSEAMLWQYQHRTKVPLDVFRKRLENEREWWMTADQALKFGAVDALVGSSKEVARQLAATTSKP